MARRPFDAYFKMMVENWPLVFIRLAFPTLKLKVISTKLDKELIAVKTRLADQVLYVSTAGECLLHFEYVSSYDPDIAHGIFLKAAMLDGKYNLEVTSVLFQLKQPPRGKNVGFYEAHLGSEPTNHFHYKVVELWKWREAILSGRKFLLVLVPLLTAISPKVDKALLARQRELLAMVKNKKLRATLLYFTIAFAKKYFSEKFLLNFFKENIKMVDPIEQVPFFGEKFREKRQTWEKEAKKEGEKTGTTSTLRKTILEVVANRFGHNGHRNGANGKITRLVNAIDEPKKLEAVFRHALTAKSLDTVVAMLEKAKPAAKRKAVKA